MAASSKSLPVSTLVLAGLAGGLAEVVWVAIYCALTPLEGSTVAQAVAWSVGADGGAASATGAAGLAIHFALSLAVAFAFGATIERALRGGLGVAAIVPLAVATLLAIWTFNFFFLLPVLSPAFVALMPLGITAASKVLFGLAMGTVIWRSVQGPVHAPGRLLAHR